jgi:glyceraldehyde-3-phosphate dehydrogenase (NAD(P))
VTGTLDELLGQADVVVDCTPKRVAAKNVEVYRRRNLKLILQGGEKHEATRQRCCGGPLTRGRATRAGS